MDLFSTPLLLSLLGSIDPQSWIAVGIDGNEVSPLWMIAASGLSGLAASLGNFAKVAIGLGLVIFVHELGHFLAAKACGVKVEKFYVGFDVPIRIWRLRIPPRLFRFTWGETEYGIGAIPLGGYVRMLGQDDNPGNAEAEAARIRTGPEGQLDPRSYPAKPVWQRMIIISAGVIMNVIFGAIFAALAFGWGVAYTPTIIAEVMPGSPAWNDGLRPGGKVVGVGSIEYWDQLHFRDMQFEVLNHGMKSKDKPMRVALRYDDGETVEHQLIPARERSDPRRSAIGVRPTKEARFLLEPLAIPNCAAATTVTDPFFRGAKITHFNGEPLPTDESSDHTIATPIEYWIQSRITEPFELTAVGENNEERKVTIPAQREKTVGWLWGIGKITGVMKGSPAEAAGLKLGDEIAQVNGNSAMDVMSFWNLLNESKEPIQLVVSRAKENSQREEIATTLEVASLSVDPGMSANAGQFGVARRGLAFDVANILVGYDGKDSEKEFNMLQAGDKVLKIKVVWGEQDPTKSMVPPALREKGYSLGPEHSPGDVIGDVQGLPVGVQLEVSYERAGRVREGVFTLVESDQRYWPDRGLYFADMERIHQATSVSEAAYLGIRETRGKLGDVFGFLKMLVTGQVSMNMFGGPLGIVYVAQNEAAQGVPRLLLFLTMLSANLAVLNFLPIPALDGGHMVFLVAEWWRGKPVDEQLQMKLTIAGVLGLLTLLIVASINDISFLAGFR